MKKLFSALLLMAMALSNPLNANPICNEIKKYTEFISQINGSLSEKEIYDCAAEMKSRGPLGGPSCRAFTQTTSNFGTLNQDFVKQMEVYDQKQKAAAQQECPKIYRRLATIGKSFMQRMQDAKAIYLKASDQFIVELCDSFKDYNRFLLSAVQLHGQCTSELQSGQDISAFSACPELFQTVREIKIFDKDENNLITRENFAYANQICPDVVAQIQDADPPYREILNDIMAQEINFIKKELN